RPEVNPIAKLLHDKINQIGRMKNALERANAVTFHEKMRIGNEVSHPLAGVEASKKPVKRKLGDPDAVVIGLGDLAGDLRKIAKYRRNPSLVEIGTVLKRQKLRAHIR